MKIAGIIGGVSSTGGAERVMCALCSYMSRQGHEVSLIVQEPETPVYPLDEGVLFLDTGAPDSPVPGVRMLRHNRKLHTILKKEKFDVAVSFMTPMNLQAIVATLGTGVPLVVSERINPANASKGKMLGRLRALLYPLAQGFVFQTPEARDFFPEKIQKRSTVIANPLKEGLPLKEAYALTGRLVSVGRLSGQKNYPLLLQAMKRIHEVFPDEQLEIYGAGSLKDSLEQQIQEMGLEKTVHLMGTFPDVHERIRTADVFVMSSDYEGMSNALAEAMAVGLPCVSTDCAGGGASFLISSGQNGLLSPVGEAEPLADSVIALLKDEEKRRSFGVQATALRERLKEETIFSQWEMYLCTMLKKKGQS